MTKAELAARLKHACASVLSAEAELTEIDSRFGDADHGLTMAKIAGAIDRAVDQSEGGIRAMLDDAAMAVMTLNGGSAVPLWNTWLDGLQEDAPEGDEIDVAGLKAIFAKALEELDDMSGAKVGDKTMMDALIPASKIIAAYQGAMRPSCCPWPLRRPSKGRRTARDLCPNSVGPRAMGPRPSAPRTPGRCQCPISSRVWRRLKILKERYVP